MAVAMEVAWRSGGAQLGSGTPDVMSCKKRAWGADTEKLMHLMMGQFSHGIKEEQTEVTLDLLGTGAGGAAVACGERGLDCTAAAEFLELDPDQPLPSGWEKCLDLKTGELYFVNKSTGARTSEDPRKYQRAAEALMSAAIVTPEMPRTPARPAHEFLPSKKSETLREENLRASTSSGTSSGEDANAKPAVTQLLSFSTGKRLWNLQLDDRSAVSVNKTATSWGGSPRAPPFPNSTSDEDSNLELNLNLSPSRPGPPQQQTVCTMEMVEQALKRTEKAMGKREVVPKGQISASSSFSSRSEPSWSRSSPSTSSSSSTSSKPGAGVDTIANSSAPGVGEAESGGSPLALVMGACTRCPMFVMVSKKDPKCPRCENEVALESFSSLPSPKRRRVEAAVSQ